MIDLINGDCIEIMGNMPSESVDLIVTDPPYLINYQSRRRVVKEKFDKMINDGEDFNLIADFMKQAERLLKDDSAIYVFCSWHNVDIFKQEFEKYFKLKNLIVWNKNSHGSGDLKGSYSPKHELILFGHKGRSLNRGKRIADVIDYAKVNSPDLTHPTEKPVGLLEVFINNSSDEGDMVLDPFAGTGSTGQACKNLGRSFTGIEIDAKYYGVMVGRLMG